MVEVIAVLEQGMSTEVWGQRFYKEAVARTKDETGKKVFQSLVDEEGKHLDILRAEYAAVASDGNWLSIEEAVAKADAVDPADVFPEAGQAEKLIAEDATDEQALKMALDFEERGYRAYRLAANQATSLAEKELWEWLAKAEDAHYQFIQETYEYLTSNGKWYFDDKELPFFEG